MYYGFGAVGLEVVLPCPPAYTVGTNLWGTAVRSRLELHTRHAGGMSRLYIQKYNFNDLSRSRISPKLFQG